MGREPGPRVTNLGAPYSATHTSPGAPAEPLPLAFPIPSPTPRALAETYRPGRCPSTGPASRASGPAPTWRRRSGRAGVGRRKGPFGRGGQGERVRGAETLVSAAAASRRAERKPEGLQESGLRLLTTTRTWKSAAPESDPRSLSFRRFLGRKLYRLSKLSSPTPPPARRRQPPPSSSDAARRHRRRDVSAHAPRAWSFPAGAPPTGV